MIPNPPARPAHLSPTCPRWRRTARPGAALAFLAVAALALTACGSAGSTAAPSTTAGTGVSSGTGGPGEGGAATTAPGTPTPSTSTPAPTTPGTPRTTPGTTAPGTITAADLATARTVRSRVSYDWGCPSPAFEAGSVTHQSTGSTVPRLVRIAAGEHPDHPAQYGYDRVAFTFTKGFPSYRFVYADLVADPSGRKVRLKGMGTLQIVFRNAQAHTATSPVRSSIVSRPARPLNLERIVDYAQAGDVEGVLTYGLGFDWAIPHSNPQIGARVIEVESVTANGVHLYTVAFDLQLGNVARG